VTDTQSMGSSSRGEAAGAPTEAQELPLFPLSTVLFKGGQLPLRIFEPRYVDMVSRCMKTQSGFGVVLIRAGSELQAPRNPADGGAAGGRSGNAQLGPKIFRTGSIAHIEDFNGLSDGTLGVVARGGAKIRIRETWLQDDGLMLGRVEQLPLEAQTAVDERFAPLVDILRELMLHPMIEKMALDIDFEDARSVGWRLAELLPIEAEIKQSLLQMHLPRERLVELVRIVNKLKG